MACKKNVFTTIKPPTAPGALPTVLAQWEILADGTVAIVDPSTLVKCPETTYQTESVCYILVDGDGTCFSGKCTIAIEYDCTAEAGSEITMTAVGILSPEGETLIIGTDATIVDCPEITTVSEVMCSAGEKG